LATSDPSEPQDFVSLLRGGEAPAEIRVFAARGLLPLDQADQIRALLAVIGDPDPDTAVIARETFRSIPPNEVSEFLREGNPLELEIDAIARQSEDPFVLEQVVRHRGVTDKTLEALARTVTGAPQEALIVNQVRLLRHPVLIDALFENPGLTADGRRQLNEIREEFFDKEKRRREAELIRQEEERARQEAGETEAPAEETEAAAGPSETSEEASLTEAAIYGRIARLTVSEKINLAYSGGKEERRILIGDANRLVGLAVLKARGLTPNEVESYALMRHLDDEILRKIAENRTWVRKPSIVLALVMNPKVPLSVALPLVKFVGLRGLKSIIRDPNLADGLRIAARKFFEEKRG
jgi:arsenate reductase-like glutaredoxin family protein